MKTSTWIALGVLAIGGAGVGYFLLRKKGGVGSTQQKLGSTNPNAKITTPPASGTDTPEWARHASAAIDVTKGVFSLGKSVYDAFDDDDDDVEF